MLDLKLLKNEIKKELAKAEQSQDWSLRSRIKTRDVVRSLSELLTKLNVLDQSDQSQVKELNKELEVFLFNRWELIKGTYLSYTSLPDEGITTICCNIAAYLAQQSKSILPEAKSALSYLMPTIANYEHILTYTDVSTLPLQHLVRFYIVSDNYDSLIPIEILNYLNTELKLADIFKNYFKSTMPELTEAEISRVIHHSPTTEAIIASYNSCQQALTEEPSLYTELQKLIKGLNQGGEHGMQGGTSNSAGVSAYIALDNFRNYWQQLTAPQQEKALSIEKLRSILNNKILNLKWSNDCVEVLAKDLSIVIATYSDLLFAINLDSTQKQSMVQKYVENLKEAQNELEVMLNSDSSFAYNGSEHLNLSNIQLIDLVGEENIEGVEDLLLLLKNSSPEEIVAICKLFKAKIINAINNADLLLNILLELNEQQIYALIKHLKKDLFRIIQGSEELGMILDFISTDAMSAFLAGLGQGQSIKSLMPSALAFKRVLAFLEDSKKNILLDSVGDDIVGWADNYYSFKTIIEFLPNERYEHFLNLIDDKLIEWSFNYVRFQDILSLLPTERKLSFIDRMADKILGWVAYSWNFTATLRDLPEERKNWFLDQMEPRLNALVIEVTSFKVILDCLPADRKDAFIASVENKLANLTFDFLHFRTLMLILEGDAKRKYIDSMENKLCSWATNLDKFKTIVSLLPDNQGIGFLEKMEEKIIEEGNAEIFALYLEAFPKARQASFIKKWEERQDVFDLSALAKAL